MDSRRVITAVGAVLFVAGGFALGAFGAAWNTRQAYAEPWAKMRVEAEGVAGKPSHTRVVFKDPKLALQAIEVFSSADGAPTLARVSLREGDELTVDYDEKARPQSLTAADGTRARFEYDGDRTRVVFLAPDGSELGSKRLIVPVQLLASRVDVADEKNETGSDSRLARLLHSVEQGLCGEARAADAEDDTVTVTREVPVGFDVRTSGADSDKPGTATLDASCAPYGCAPTKRDITVPGQVDASITVTGTVKKSALGAASADKVKAFAEEARAERKAATHTLPAVARVIGAVGVASMACKSLGLTAPMCIKEFGTNPGAAGGAILSVEKHVVETDASILDPRAEELYYEEEARAQLDKETKIEACLSREGFARVCATIDGRPFGTTPIAKTSHALELRRGVGGTLVGSFVMTQSDGADCKFSPSPRTAGDVRLTFDNDKNTVTAALGASERGSRPNMGCSLGTANMTWSQTYTVSASQTFTKEQLGHGGKLPLAMHGTMSGSGSYSFSNCRTGDGASASCPPGKGDGYSYPVVFEGTIDLDSHVGSGQIVVSNAPLVTQGTWRIPAEPKP